MNPRDEHHIGGLLQRLPTIYNPRLYKRLVWATLWASRLRHGNGRVWMEFELTDGRRQRIAGTSRELLADLERFLEAGGMR